MFPDGSRTANYYDTREIPMTCEKPVPVILNHGLQADSALLTTAKSKQIIKRFNAWWDAYDLLKKQRQKISNDIQNTLASFRTVKTLIDGWPEIEPTLKTLGITPYSVAQYPVAVVGMTKKLNELIGLPEPEKELEAA
jgi:hypothetical protein